MLPTLDGRTIVPFAYRSSCEPNLAEHEIAQTSPKSNMVSLTRRRQEQLDTFVDKQFNFVSDNVRLNVT
jgi:hypothetical protein